MKNLIKIITLFSVIIIVLSSCDNQSELDIKVNNILDKSKIESASLQQKIDYTNHHLLEVGTVISKLTRNTNFKEILFNSIDKKVYEGSDSQIQVRYLIDNIKANKNISINEQDELRLNKALDAFTNLDDEDWYPAIYITDFENQYNDFQNNESQKNYDNTKPLIVPVVVEDNDEFIEDKYEAYQEIDDDNVNLEKMDFEVGESDSENYDIIFIKIAEACVEGSSNDGDFPKSCGSSGSGNPPPNPTEPNLYLNRMTGKHHKESVGRSEIAVKGSLHLITNYYPLTTNHIAGRHIQYSYKRRWIRRESSRVLNDNYTVFSSNGLSPESETIFSWVVYEYDPWPAPKRYRTIYHSLNNGPEFSIPVDFRSWQSEYDKDAISSFQNNNEWLFENGGIKYNLKKILTN